LRPAFAIYSIFDFPHFPSKCNRNRFSRGSRLIRNVSDMHTKSIKHFRLPFYVLHFTFIHLTFEFRFDMLVPLRMRFKWRARCAAIVCVFTSVAHRSPLTQITEKSKISAENTSVPFSSIVSRGGDTTFSRPRPFRRHEQARIIAGTVPYYASDNYYAGSATQRRTP